MPKQRKQRVTEAEVAAALGVWMRWACSGETLHDRMRASLEAALSSRASQAGGEGPHETWLHDPKQPEVLPTPADAPKGDVRRALFILDRETAALRFTHLDSSSLRWAKERIREALASTPAQDEVETLRRALFASLYAINWTASDSWDSGRESRARLEWARDKIQRALGGRLDNNQLASIGKQFLAETGAREALSRPPYQGDPEALQDAIKLERRGKSE